MIWACLFPSFAKPIQQWNFATTTTWNLSFLLGVKKHSYNYSLFSDAEERYFTTLFATTLFFRLTTTAGTKKVLTNSRHSRVTSLLNSGIGWKKCYFTTLTTAFGPDWTYLILCFHSAGGIQFLKRLQSKTTQTTNCFYYRLSLILSHLCFESWLDTRYSHMHR